MAVQGIESRSSGGKLTSILQLFHLQNMTLQQQVSIMACTTLLIFILKTASSIFLTKKTLSFLAIKASNLTSLLVEDLLHSNILRIQMHSVQQFTQSIYEGVNNIFAGILANVSLFISDTALLIFIAVGMYIVDPVVSLLTLLLFISIAYFMHRLLSIRAHAMVS